MGPAIYLGEKVAYVGQNNQAIKSKNIKFYKHFAFFDKKKISSSRLVSKGSNFWIFF